VSNGQSLAVGSAPAARKAVGKTVLIVEDNELNMKLFHDLLEAHGYDTLQTRDGVEALKIARQHKPDLILMDIQLPEVSGLEVAKWIKRSARAAARRTSPNRPRWRSSWRPSSVS
jgi:two-component system, cell cycle response regulator DivK